MKIVDAKAIGWSSIVGGGIALTAGDGKKFQVAFMGVNGGIDREETEELTKLVLNALSRPQPQEARPVEGEVEERVAAYLRQRFPEELGIDDAERVAKSLAAAGLLTALPAVSERSK
jgi:hypothetical protein